jgi:hypothetical protein
VDENKEDDNKEGNKVGELFGGENNSRPEGRDPSGGERDEVGDEVEDQISQEMQN